MAHQTDVDLLVIGKTGMGKSAVGNAILKRKKFKSISSTNSVTSELDSEVTNYKGKIIKVVDGPGIGDTRLDKKDSVELVCGKMAQAMRFNPQGYSAFLLVARYGTRFTEEDRDTVNLLKNMFGQQFISQYCIMVMTCGDIFEHDYEDVPDFNFSKWCREQSGVFQELLEECRHRIVLFDNITRDVAKRDAQMDNLLEMVSTLQSQCHRYTDTNFQHAGALREKARVEVKKPEIQEETLKEIRLIMDKLNEEEKTYGYDKPVTTLQELSGRCGRLLERLRDQDRETGALGDLIEQVTSVKQSVDKAISDHTAAVQEKQKMKEKEDQMRKQMEEKIQRKKWEMDEIRAEMKENIEMQKQQYKETMQQSREDKEEMRRDFEKRRQDLEEESKIRLQRLEKELEEKHRKHEEMLESKREQEVQALEQRLAKTQEEFQTQAQNMKTACLRAIETSENEDFAKTLLMGTSQVLGSLLGTLILTVDDD